MPWTGSCQQQSCPTPLLLEAAAETSILGPRGHVRGRGFDAGTVTKIFGSKHDPTEI